MANYSKFSDVEAVLLKSKDTLVRIEVGYKNALYLQKIPDSLLVDIKDYLGNLRSAMDFINAKIDNSDEHFPICSDKNDFEKRYGKVKGEIKTVLLKYQPFNNNTWIKWFNILNNKNKHVTLIPQKRIETLQTRVSRGGGSVSWGNGVIFGNGVSVMGVPIDPRTQMPVPNNVLKTEKITWINFVFDNSVSSEMLPNNISALPFLKMCFEKISLMISELDLYITV
jgi:hypothetical protein